MLRSSRARRVPSLASLLLVGASGAATLAACSQSTTVDASSGGTPETPAACKTDGDCASNTATPICDVPVGKCIAKSQGTEIGKGDGTSASVTFTVIKEIGASAKPIDLAFNSESPGELWVLGQADNSAHTGRGVDGDNPTWIRNVDPAARHFMHRPPAIAWAQGANEWATCGDNDNGHNQPDQIPNYFMGPALFTADLTIFARRTPGGLGSHLDMLHSTPFCRGIAHVQKREYWVFNSYDKSLDKYDFREDHGPGNDDHSDGTIFRYAVGKVKGADDGTPSHLFYDPSDKFLYVADTGNARIVRLDTTKGTKGASLPRRNEPLVDEGFMDGTDVEEVVAPGVLEKPCGLEIKGGLLYVTDAATSTFHVFEKTGKEVRKLATDLPARSLAGFTFGPDGKIWFTDAVGGKVMRIDPK